MIRRAMYRYFYFLTNIQFFVFCILIVGLLYTSQLDQEYAKFREEQLHIRGNAFKEDEHKEAKIFFDPKQGSKFQNLF